MGLVLISKNADFSANAVDHLGLFTSLTDGLVLLHETRRSESKAIRNSAPNGGDAYQFGAPAYDANSVAVSPSSGLVFDAYPGGSSTLIAVAYTQPDGGTADRIVGSVMNAANGGVTMFSFGGQAGVNAYSYPIGQTVPITAGNQLHAAYFAAGSGRYEMLVATCENNVSARFRVPRTGTQAVSAAVGRVFMVDRPNPIKTVPEGSQSQDIAVVAYWNRALTNAEQDTFYGEMQDQLGRLGIVI